MGPMVPNLSFSETVCEAAEDHTVSGQGGWAGLLNRCQPTRKSAVFIESQVTASRLTIDAEAIVLRAGFIALYRQIFVGNIVGGSNFNLLRLKLQNLDID